MLISCSPRLLWAEQKKRGLNVSKGFRCKWELCEAGRSCVPKQMFQPFLVSPKYSPLHHTTSSFVSWQWDKNNNSKFLCCSYFMPGPVIKVFTHIHFSQRHDEITTIVIPILQVRKLRYRVNNLPKVTQPINGRASISSLMPKSILFTTTLYCSSVCMTLERNSVSGRAGRKAS